MNDREFLIWIHARLTDVHGEDARIDYMRKLRAIISAMPEDKNTPNISVSNNLGELLEMLNNANQS